MREGTRKCTVSLHHFSFSFLFFFFLLLGDYADSDPCKAKIANKECPHGCVNNTCICPPGMRRKDDGSCEGMTITLICDQSQGLH